MTENFRIAALSAVALGSFALAGCGSNDTVEAENVSAESVAEQVAKADLTPQAGRWESTMTIEKMEIGGMLPEAQKAMKDHMGTTQTFTSCLTPEEAAKPKADFFQGKDSGCDYEKFSMGDGKIDAVMTCQENGHSQKMTMMGTYGEQSYDMKVTADGEAGPGMPMSMAMSITSRRVGECNGNEEK